MLSSFILLLLLLSQPKTNLLLLLLISLSLSFFLLLLLPFSSFFSLVSTKIIMANLRICSRKIACIACMCLSASSTGSLSLPSWPTTSRTCTALSSCCLFPSASWCSTWSTCPSAPHCTITGQCASTWLSWWRWWWQTTTEAWRQTQDWQQNHTYTAQHISFM